MDDDRSVSVYSGASTSTYNEDAGSNTPDTMFDDALDGASRSGTPDGINSFEGLIMNADVCRNNADYVKFMAVYQVGLYIYLSICSPSPLPLEFPPLWHICFFFIFFFL